MRRDSTKVGDHPSFALNSAFSNQVYVLLLEKLVKSSPGKVAISPSFSLSSSPPPRCNASCGGEGEPPPPLLISVSRSLSFPPILPAIIHFFYFFLFRAMRAFHVSRPHAANDFAVRERRRRTCEDLREVVYWKLGSRVEAHKWSFLFLRSRSKLRCTLYSCGCKFTGAEHSISPPPPFSFFFLPPSSGKLGNQWIGKEPPTLPPPPLSYFGAKGGKKRVEKLPFCGRLPTPD